MTTELQHITAAMPGTLALVGEPNNQIAQAKKAADALVKVVKANGWIVKIGPAEHLKVEAWQTLAHFYGVSARVRDTEPYVDDITGAAGFKATAEAILISSGQIIGQGMALCLNNEENWDSRPKYEKGEHGEHRKVGEAAVPSFQLQSMAQTRAIGKTLRGVLAFVVALAGYNTTPAEEVTGTEQRGEHAENGGNGNGKAARITDGQRKLLFGKAKEYGCPVNALVAIYQKKHGFNQAFEITKDALDPILEDVKNWQNIPEAVAAKGGAA